MNDQRTSSPRPRAGGVILMEVVFALALFVGGASVILSGLSASVQSAMRLGAEAVADDLVVTLLSEVRMQLVPIADDYDVHAALLFQDKGCDSRADRHRSLLAIH